MRQQYIYLIFLLINAGASAQVGINNPSPHASAALDVTSTTKGFLPPRMTKSDRDAIASPAIGLIVFCADCGFYGEAQIYNGNGWTNMIGGAVSTPVPNVTNPTTGKIWMNRNLGASQVATASTDAASYGDMYQWGRATEGHEKRTSITTSSLATSAAPNGGNPWQGFLIITSSSPNDWLTPQNNTLWQGVNGTNNPCPNGYRLPTEAEWEAERLSWAPNNNTIGAFASPLKLPSGGRREGSSGAFFAVSSYGYYWSSTVSGTDARSMFFYNTNAGTANSVRTSAISVRCIKN